MVCKGKIENSLQVLYFKSCNSGISFRIDTILMHEILYISLSFGTLAQKCAASKASYDTGQAYA